VSNLTPEKAAMSGEKKNRAMKQANDGHWLG
jgi:hypothetical protein